MKRLTVICDECGAEYPPDQCHVGRSIEESALAVGWQTRLAAYREPQHRCPACTRRSDEAAAAGEEK